MQSHQRQRAVTDFIEEAAHHLQGQLSAGTEMPFELASSSGRRGSTALYSYRPLSERFIKEHWDELRKLDSYTTAAHLTADTPGLERYLLSRGITRIPVSPARCAEAALLALLTAIFAEQSDFDLAKMGQHSERIRAALGSLEGSASTQAAQVTVLATLHGITLSSAELTLAGGLSLTRSDELQDAPEQILTAADGQPQLLVIFTSDDGDVHRAIRQGRAVLAELLRTLRLFGDGRIALGGLAWARVGTGSWQALALTGGGRPHGMLLVTPEQEDELRAFCNLVSRRNPDGNELAWALDRFQMGCERDDEYQALSDYLMGLRTLLEPEGPSSGLLAGRLAALCSTPDRRAWLTERITRALALERAVIAGTASRNAAGEDLVRAIADYLRALLRDVICGHLDADLTLLADELLTPEPQPQPSEELQLAQALGITEDPLPSDLERSPEPLWIGEAEEPLGAPI